MTKRIIKFIFRGELEIEEVEDVVVPPVEPPVEPEVPTGVIDWNKLSSEGGVIESGFDYIVENYTTSVVANKTINITKNGDKPTSITFGKAGYSKWQETQQRFLFDCRENTSVHIDGIDLYTAQVADEVDPFYITIFTGQGLNQNLKLSNLKTNMESGLLYSVSQDVTQEIISKDVDFTGYIWQELKANGGGGLKVTMEDCELTQIDPNHYFESSLTFSRDSVQSSIPFSAIENTFHSLQKQNACNILYVNGMTFYLPWGKQLGNTHPIRPIPNVGEVIELTQGSSFLYTTKNSLQAGDILEINGVDYTIISKDRHAYPEFQQLNYPIDINIGQIVGSVGSTVTAKVKKSQGLSLIGISSLGYMIFKDNKNFQTNIVPSEYLNLEYYLKSNPLGVLSYNHKEITMFAKNTNHNGFYRQSQSGVGHTNGYEMINCTGFEDQFNPDA